jgi:uncharacterized protein
MSFTQLARDLRTSERTLRRAAADGVLRARRLGPRRSLVGTAERDYLRSHWSELRALRNALRTEPNVAFAALFGSLARGDDRPDSDADVLVELRRKGPLAPVKLQARLTERLGRQVQVVSLEQAEREPSLLAEAIAEGRPLVDRIGRWRRLQSARPALEERARVHEERLRDEARATLERLAR